jgi:hypothetical protein
MPRVKSRLGTALASDLDAQRTFLGCLVPYLSDHGAMSLEEIQGAGIRLFRLPLADDEVADLLELARRQGLVHPQQGNDAYGQATPREWIATDRGREVRPPTGLTVKDARTYIMRVTPFGSKLTGVAQAAIGALPIAALLKISDDDVLGKGALVAGCVLAVLLLLVLYLGFKGDLRLRRAAIAWQRYQELWPVSHSWQLSIMRPLLGFAGLLLYFAPVLLFLAARLELPGWLPWAAFGLGLVAMLALLWERHRTNRERKATPLEPEPIVPAKRELVGVGSAHAGDFPDEADLTLLLRHVPNLHYDAQEGYRAVTAATMTDAPRNALVAESGEIIAGHGSGNALSLDTLAGYPDGFDFSPRDHLASADPALADALRLQADADRYPHATHGRVVRRGKRIWLEYWLWYYDNPKTFLGKGRHQGDWELVIVELDAGERPQSVTCSQHNGGEARRWRDVEKQDEHPVIYVAPFSHANYFEGRTTFYFPGADHPTPTGPYLRPTVVPFGKWENWRGRWGASRGVFGGRFNLGGTSPEAPIVQEPRWNRPNRYHRTAAARKPVALFFRIFWWLGKRTFPLAPILRLATIDNDRLTVTYTLRGDLLHFGRHLLLTVHSDDDVQALLASEVLRSAPDHGHHAMSLPPGTASCIVYASVFNSLNQRSDPVRLRV